MAASRVRRPRPRVKAADSNGDVIEEIYADAYAKLTPIIAEYSIKGDQKREIGILSASYTAGIKGALEYLERYDIIPKVTHDNA